MNAGCLAASGGRWTGVQLRHRSVEKERRMAAPDHPAVTHGTCVHQSRHARPVNAEWWPTRTIRRSLAKPAFISRAMRDP
jgi:hypothetical protein